MDILSNEPLPGCESVERAEELYLNDAVDMELRERTARYPEHARFVTRENIVTFFAELKRTDAAVYATSLYAKSRLAAVFCDYSDAQLRNALVGTSVAVGDLYSDWEVIRPAARTFRRNERRADDAMTEAVRSRVIALLPRMLEKVTSHAKTQRDAVPKRHIAKGVSTAGAPEIAALPPAIAQAVLRLRTMIYVRHPVDLLHEIVNWEIDMEHSE